MAGNSDYHRKFPMTRFSFVYQFLAGFLMFGHLWFKYGPREAFVFHMILCGFHMILYGFISFYMVFMWFYVILFDFIMLCIVLYSVYMKLFDLYMFFFMWSVFFWGKNWKNVFGEFWHSFLKRLNILDSGIWVFISKKSTLLQQELLEACFWAHIPIFLIPKIVKPANIFLVIF